MVECGGLLISANVQAHCTFPTVHFPPVSIKSYQFPSLICSGFAAASIWPGRILNTDQGTHSREDSRRNSANYPLIFCRTTFCRLCRYKRSEAHLILFACAFLDAGPRAGTINGIGGKIQKLKSSRQVQI